MTHTSRFTLQGRTGPWHITIGLENHAQIISNSKLFSGAPTAFGNPENTQVTFFDAAFPGMLPVVNKRCIEQAIKTSLALEGHIHLRSFFDRKNYFYPDSPAGYQISQLYRPLMVNGRLQITCSSGEKKDITIKQLHIEQDAGKSLHDEHNDCSLIDLNRAGVGLMEIVSEPQLTSPEEAVAYAKALRLLLIYVGSCDGDMEKGNYRTDVNISIHRPDEPMGTRVELKNINSFKFIQDAILAEAHRQIALRENDMPVVQETRRYDFKKGETFLLRSKEDAPDYRYFPEPDLPPLVLEEAWIEELKAALPELPVKKRQRYESMGLSPYDAQVITDDPETAAFFESALQHVNPSYAKLTSNWLIGDVFGALNKQSLTLQESRLSPALFAQFIETIGSGRVTGPATKALLGYLLDTGEEPHVLIERHDLGTLDDLDQLTEMTQQVMQEHPNELALYLKGKTTLAAFFVGRVMKKCAGRANPERVNQAVTAALKSHTTS